MIRCEIIVILSVRPKLARLTCAFVPKLDQESSSSIQACFSDLLKLWTSLESALAQLAIGHSQVINSLASSPTADDSAQANSNLEKTLRFRPLIEAMFVQRQITTTTQLTKVVLSS